MYLLNKDLEKYTLRKEQQDALNFIENEFKERGNITKFFMLDLPTGVGKSVLCLSIIDFYLKTINKRANFDVITNSKILQEQYFDEFKSMSNLWGKNNYQCSEYDCSCEQGKEFAKLNKSKCEDCPYDSARESYLKDKINITNFHLFSLLNIYSGKMLEQRDSNVLIIDEAHDLEQIVSDFISINLSESILKRTGFNNYKSIARSLNSINNIEDFVEFSDKLKEETATTLTFLKHEAIRTRDKGQVSKLLKKYEDVNTLNTKLEQFLKDYQIRPENWILEYEFSDKKEKKIMVQPVWAGAYLDEYFWSKYDHIFFMSGTILNKSLFSYINGIPEALAAYYRIESPFITKNRPIFYINVSKMNFKNKKYAFEAYKPFIQNIMRKYGTKKGIFHTVTYEIAEWMRQMKDDRLIFHSPEDKDKALKKHYALEDKPTVLVSPSMGTGVNLEYDRARFQVLLKIPYPSLGSKKNKLRMSMNKDWFTYRTVLGIIQAYGRGVRAYDDHCDFIILDGCFSDIMRYSSEWLPDYVKNAIRAVDVKKLKMQMES